MSTDTPSAHPPTNPPSDPPETPNPPPVPCLAPVPKPPNKLPEFLSLDQLAPTIPPVTWLWPGWIPRAMITLLCAAPGAGKSYFALDLARRLIAGLPWPDGAPQGAGGAPSVAASVRASAAASARSGVVAGAQAGAPPAVIYVDAEAAPQLLNARAVAWGMDRSRLFPMLAPSYQVLDLNTSACQDRLFKMATALRPALIVVDSLGSAARGAENRPGAIDALFNYLNDIAVTFQCGLLVIHHLRKHSPLAAGHAAPAALDGDEVRGSGHIVSLARSVLGLAPVQIGLDPQPNTPHRLQLIKTNLGPFPDPLCITLTPSANGGVDLAYSPAPEPTRRLTAVESCARWLYELLSLAGRPVGPTELEEPAYAAGYSRATLFRARELLGFQVVDTRGRHYPGNCWVLPPWPRPEPPANSAPKPSKPRSSRQSS